MTNIIGYLMYLANNEGVKSAWYPLKDKLCRKYGVPNGYDLQYIAGKKCNCCNGTGIYKKHTYHGIIKEQCYRCDKGWYKPSVVVLLERSLVGQHVFHKPVLRANSSYGTIVDLTPSTVIIKGYVEHKKKKYGWLAFTLLFLLFDFKGYKSYVKTFGVGWRCSWWLPKNYLHNLMHIKKRKGLSYPAQVIKQKLSFLRREELEELPY